MLIEETKISFENARGLLETGLLAIKNKDGVIDFQNVKKVDSSAVALALGWLREAEKSGGSLKLANRPASFNTLLKLYGLSEVFK